MFDSNQEKNALAKEASARSSFLLWLHGITIHGFPNIFISSSTLLKTIWIVSFLLSTAACGYMISLTVTSYLAYEVVTKIEYIDVTSLTFPKITVCSTNPFITDAGVQFVTNALLKNNITDVTNSNVLSAAYPVNMSQISMNYLAALNLAQAAANDGNINDSTRQSFGLTFDQMFISCVFATAECSRDYWTWYYDSRFGNCFNFNTGWFPNGTKYSPLNATQVGTEGGLSVELYVPVNGNKNSLSTAAGVQLFINTNSAFVNSGKGQRLPLGYSNYIGLERTISSSLPSPYSECVQATSSVNGYNSFLFKFLVQANYTYSRENCGNLYVQTVVIEKCGCFSSIVMNVNASARACSTIADNQCFTSTFQALIKSNYKATINNICPLECSTTTHEFLVTALEYPTESYGMSLLQEPRVKAIFNNNTENVTLYQLRSSFISVGIYFRFIRYTSMTEIPSMPPDILIANIGGNLALFLGMSVLSFIEIVDLIIQLVQTIFNKCMHHVLVKEKKKKQQQQPSTFVHTLTTSFGQEPDILY